MSSSESPAYHSRSKPENTSESSVWIPSILAQSVLLDNTDISSASKVSLSLHVRPSSDLCLTAST